MGHRDIGGQDKNSMHQLLAIGAGGHARSVIDAVQLGDDALIWGILDNETALWGTKMLGVPVLGPDEKLNEAVDSGCTGFVIALGAIGAFELRESLYQRCLESGLAPYTVRHPSAVLAKSAVLDGGVQLLASSVVGPEATIGENVIVNTGAVVEHDCVVGSHTHVAPRACLCGGVRVGRKCHIGVGAVVKENITIEDGAVVGAGAVVLRDVTADSVVAGVPARLLKGHNHES